MMHALKWTSGQLENAFHLKALLAFFTHIWNVPLENNISRKTAFTKREIFLKAKIIRIGLSMRIFIAHNKNISGIVKHNTEIKSIDYFGCI